MAKSAVYPGKYGLNPIRKNGYNSGYIHQKNGYDDGYEVL